MPRAASTLGLRYCSCKQNQRGMMNGFSAGVHMQLDLTGHGGWWMNASACMTLQTALAGVSSQNARWGYAVQPTCVMSDTDFQHMQDLTVIK